MVSVAKAFPTTFESKLTKEPSLNEIRVAEIKTQEIFRESQKITHPPIIDKKNTSRFLEVELDIRQIRPDFTEMS